MIRGVLGGRPLLRLVVIALGLTALSAWTARRGRGYWLGNPTIALGQAQDLTIFGSAIVASYGAWLSGHARGMGQWLESAPRPRAEVDCAPMVFAAVAGVSAYESVLLWMLLSTGAPARSLTHDGVGMAATVLMLGGCAVFWSGVGVAAGRWLPPVAALAVAPLVAYASFLVLAVYLSTSPLTALSLGGNLVFSSVEPTTGAWCAKSLFWLSLGTLATAVVAVDRRWLVTAAAWVTGACAAVLILFGAPLQPVPTSPPVCQGRLPRVCVNSGNVAVLSPYTQQVDRLWRLLPASLRPPIVTDSIAAQQLTSSDAADVLVAGPIDGPIEPSSTIDPVEFAILFGDRAIQRACSSTGPDDEAVAALQLWWRSSVHGATSQSAYPGAPQLGDPPAPTRQQAAALSTMTTSARDLWVRRQVIGRCRARP